MTHVLRRSFGRLCVVFAVLLGATTIALGQARIEDCEKIQAADAYNQCLAKFGPTSKVKNVTPPKPGDVKGSGEEAAGGVPATDGGAATSVHGGRHGRSHVARGHRGSRHYATRGSGKRGGKTSGRKRMTITVKRRH